MCYCSNWGLPASLHSSNLLTLMASPCPRCGATKTGHVKRGLARWLLEQFGFRLRICGGCRRYRIFRFTRAAKDGGSNHDSSHAVPDTVNHEERKPPTQQSSQSSGGELSDDPASGDPASEAQASAVSATSESVRQGAAPRACPECGSTNYRRSRRTSWERARGVPPMVRCRDCRYRFQSPD